MGDLMSRAGRATRALVAGRLHHGWSRCAPPSRRYCMSRPDVIARAGRASCTMAGRLTLHAMADDGRRLSHFVSRGRACVALLDACCLLLDAPPGRALLVDDARRSRDVARCRREFLLVVAPPSPAATPASFWRCRDGWSDFF
ncbi:hypothetical protein F511_42108 [Dorcoceras hygrometricum]|uniref:Uncharacterized protein n=1 Tax=Dorcoceras hygrometricum TaxID=472368 RepID=A0A2Z7CYX5_9LAMI|nr:hypothetical protein F511_42108 [Dorcoceras hygrometricum]